MRMRDLQVILAAERLVGYSAGRNNLRGPEDCNSVEFATMWRELDKARGDRNYASAIHHSGNYVDAWQRDHPGERATCEYVAALVAEVGVWRFEEADA